MGHKMSTLHRVANETKRHKTRWQIVLMTNSMLSSLTVLDSNFFLEVKNFKIYVMLSHDEHDVTVETGDTGFNNTIHLVELQ